MNEKFTIINAIDITDDITILVIKKKKEELKKCCECEHFKWWGDLNTHYCNKHKELVDKTDYCIEVGM